MALFGGKRDISMFRHINRELMHKIISQQVVFYKVKVEETNTNIYGEAAEGRHYVDPILLFSLVETGNFEYPESDLGVDFKWSVTYKFLRDDLVDANVYPEVGDIIMYQNGYWEIDGVNTSQFFMGKNPAYPYLDDEGNNPFETDLGDFGYNVSVICTAHYTPGDRINIQKSRM
jgi:hypothetical protein